MYGRAHGYCKTAQYLYRQTFSQKRCPAKNTFIFIHHRLREAFLPSAVNRKQNKNFRTAAIRVEENSFKFSTRDRLH